MISQKVINCIENSTEFMTSIKLDVLKDILMEADNLYYNEKKPLLTDNTYDKMRNYVISKDPTFTNNQHTDIEVEGDDKVTLPVWMGSMTKKKTVSNENDVVVSDKLDGISCLVDKTKSKIKLYTRGNGKVGRDITKLIKFINGIDMNMDDKIMVRGELIMTKDNFQLIKEDESNPRNTVAGFVNSKNPKPKFNKKVDFIVYEVIKPKHLTPKQQFEYISNNTKFTVVNHKFFNTITKEELSKYLNERKNKSVYEIDGIIVAKNSKYDYITTGNPKHAFAYKENSVENHKKTKVVKVEWNISKDKYIKPIVHVEEVCINNVCIKKTTGYNAKYIKDNNIGKGTEITIERSGDVIPKIVSVDKPTVAEMPSYKYLWNETGVDIYVADDDVNTKKEVDKKTFVNMVEKLEIDSMGKTTIVKLFDMNVRTLKELYKLSEKDIIKLEGFSEKSSNTLYTNIQAKKKSLKCIDYMIASNCFGRGFGLKVFKLILEKYPINTNVNLSQLESIDGIGSVKAKNYIEGLNKFKQFLKDNDIEDICNESKVTPLVTTTNGKLKGEKIVFTGFRDKDLAKFITDNGGENSDSLTKSVTLLLYKDLSKSSGKLEKAEKMNIKTMNVDEFKKNYEYI